MICKFRNAILSIFNKIAMDRKKAMAVCLMISLITVLMAGCSGEKNLSNVVIKGADGEDSMEALKAIMKCIQQRDRNGMLSEFSTEAQATGLDEKAIGQLFELFSEEKIVLIYDGGSGSLTTHYGKITDSYKQFYVTETIPRYRILIEGCVKNDYNQNAVGVKRIIVYPEDYGPYPDTPEYGVYVFE